MSINGRLLNQPFLDNVDTRISINFLQSDTPPDYPCSETGEYLLGVMTFSRHQLSTEITVDRNVYEELRKNLTEYADIDGIHIIISLEVLSHNDHWQENEQLNIIQLDYAMKGD